LRSDAQIVVDRNDCRPRLVGRPESFTEAFKVGKLLDGFVLPPWDCNVAPATFRPVIRNNKETAERELVMMRWGMVPHFAKSLADFKGVATINAKAESMMKNATWRSSLPAPSLSHT
jgi:putative SOS response-associated peptidase YedK